MSSDDDKAEDALIGEEEEEEEDSDEPTSDDESSSDSDEAPEISEADLKLLMSLESKLEANVLDYDAHIQLIEKCRACNLKAKLRTSQERMAAAFPLTEALWMAWVNDELSHLEGPEDIERIAALFQRATQDYLSVDIWCARLDFVLELDPEVADKSPSGVKKARDLCEAGLTAVGLHVTEGGKVWDAYLKWEMALESAQARGDKQEERVRGLFCRQLQVPLANAASTLEAYTQWEAARGKTVPPHILKAHEKAQQAVALRRPYEQALEQASLSTQEGTGATPESSAKLLAAHMAYIKLELSADEPSRVSLAYERAIASFPVTTELWIQYARYLEVKMSGIHSLAQKVYDRALRNCYWSGALWARAIRCVARASFLGSNTGPSSSSLEDQKGLYDRAVRAGLQDYEGYVEVMLAYIDGLRQALGPDLKQGSVGLIGSGAEAKTVMESLRAAFEGCMAMLSSYFPEVIDRSMRLPAYWAHCESRLLNDVPSARKVWEEVLKSPLSKYCDPWLAYVEMERSLGNIKEARGVFKRGFGKRLEEGGQLTLCASWLRFEREEGGPEDYLSALIKVEPIMEEAASAAAAVAMNEGAAAAARQAAKEAPQLSKEEMARMRREKDPNFKRKEERQEKAPSRERPMKNAPEAARQLAPAARNEGKRSRGDEDPHDTAMQEDDQALKRPRLHPPPQHHDKDQNEEAMMVVEKEEADHQGGGIQEEDEEMLDEGHPSAAPHPAQPFKRYEDERTVFVKGLQPSVTQEDLRGLFSQCGELVAVRPVMDPNQGTCRGFAYVEFGSDQALGQAEGMNGVMFQGRKLFVAKSKPPGSGSGSGGGRGRGGLQDRGGRGGGRGRGRGEGGGGGRGRGGLGFQTFKGGGGGRGGGGGHRQHLDIGGGGGGQAAHQPPQPQPQGQPLSNDAFRAMLLKK